jgi:hypothetical protein
LYAGSATGPHTNHCPRKTRLDISENKAKMFYMAKNNVINLNKVRKTRNRSDDKTRADANAVLYGLSKPLRDLEKARQRKAQETLDGAKLEGESRDGDKTDPAP